MENRDTTIRLIIGAVIIITLSIMVMHKSNNTPNQSKVYINQNEDSLKNVISNLEIDFKKESDGWDTKESRYEEIIFEYEYGLSHLKETHPEAYREFHRIIGFKERYSRDVEKENKKRLNLNWAEKL